MEFVFASETGDVPEVGDFAFCFFKEDRSAVVGDDVCVGDGELNCNVLFALGVENVPATSSCALLFLRILEEGVDASSSVCFCDSRAESEVSTRPSTFSISLSSWSSFLPSFSSKAAPRGEGTNVEILNWA